MVSRRFSTAETEPLREPVRALSRPLENVAPDYEKDGNYVPSVLPRRYDAFCYLDETHALRPLPMPLRPEPEVPETYPTGV